MQGMSHGRVIYAREDVTIRAYAGRRQGGRAAKKNKTKLTRAMDGVVRRKGVFWIFGVAR